MSAPDIDGWIVQAKELRNDIERSQKIANHIVTRADEGSNLESKVQDASAKLDLLQREVTFNGALEETLQRLLELRNSLSAGQAAILRGDLLDAVSLLQNTEHNLETLQVCRKTRIAELIRTRSADLRTGCQTALTAQWESTIQPRPASSKISIRLGADGVRLTPLTKIRS